MAKRLLGKEVNEALVASLQTRTAALREKGTIPTLGIDCKRCYRKVRTSV